MEQNVNYVYEDEMEIDLREIFFTLLNKWHIIFLSGVLCALLGLLAAMFLMPEKFQSKTSIYIYDQQKESMSYTDLQISTVLTKDYEVLIKGRAVLETVIEELELDCSYSALNSMVTVNVPESTRIVEIIVETTDPYLSKDIADAVREVSSETIKSVMSVDAVNVVEAANLPEGKSSPSISKFTLLGGMLGVVAASGIILLLFLTNDTIRSQEDVEKYLGLSVLGTIPYEEELKAEGKKKSHRFGGDFLHEKMRRPGGQRICFLLSGSLFLGFHHIGDVQGAQNAVVIVTGVAGLGDEGQLDGRIFHRDLGHGLTDAVGGDAG